MLSLENLRDGQTETTWLTAHATDQIHLPQYCSLQRTVFYRM